MPLPLPLADGSLHGAWPDAVDATAVGVFFALVVGLPLAGYVFIVLDIRRHLRSLRRQLVLVAQSMPHLPYWFHKERPPCLHALDLHLPCTEEAVLAAYRERVKALHPDRGGDMQAFLRLQRHFEQALYLVRNGANEPHSS